MNNYSQTNLGVTPWLSVLIPVYNVSPYLEECITSVLDQTDDAIEVVLCDDASTDGSTLKLCSLAARYPGRLRLLFNRINTGLSATRNRLLEESAGDWIWFIDSDDILLPGSIKSLFQWVQRPSVDLVLCDFISFRSPPKPIDRFMRRRLKKTNDILPHTPCQDKSAILEGLFAREQMHSWSKIARRSLYGRDLRFPPGRCFEDIFVSPDLLIRAQCAVYVDQAWIGYRKRQGSILSTPSIRKGQDMIDALCQISLLLHNTHEDLNYNVKIAAGFYSMRTGMTSIQHAIRIGNLEVASKQLEQLILGCPISVGQVLGYCFRRRWPWRAIKLWIAIEVAKVRSSKMQGHGDWF